MTTIDSPGKCTFTIHRSRRINNESISPFSESCKAALYKTAAIITAVVPTALACIALWFSGSLSAIIITSGTCLALYIPISWSVTHLYNNGRYHSERAKIERRINEKIEAFGTTDINKLISTLYTHYQDFLSRIINDLRSRLPPGLELPAKSAHLAPPGAAARLTPPEYQLSPEIENLIATLEIAEREREVVAKQLEDRPTISTVHNSPLRKGQIFPSISYEPLDELRIPNRTKIAEQDQKMALRAIGKIWFLIDLQREHQTVIAKLRDSTNTNIEKRAHDQAEAYRIYDEHIINLKRKAAEILYFLENPDKDEIVYHDIYPRATPTEWNDPNHTAHFYFHHIDERTGYVFQIPRRDIANYHPVAIKRFLIENLNKRSML